ncbi:hypothetical protein RB195_002999 [Necator americanus]|uniref:Integrase catalytic domain-containing protein n=1 Tax=Necator americanus TaxID=51031 RepID=A0ABR1DMX8_NECAM
MSSTSVCCAVITVMKKIFAQIGNPKTIVTDNRLPYLSIPAYGPGDTGIEAQLFSTETTLKSTTLPRQMTIVVQRINEHRHPAHRKLGISCTVESYYGLDAST